MRIQRGPAYGLTLIGLLSLAFAGWTHSTPASAQDEPKPVAPVILPAGGPATLAASGDYVYVLRGNTLYQMKATDLSLVKQQDLPAQGQAADAKKE